MNRKIHGLLIALAMLLLTACGGGGSSSSSNVPTTADVQETWSGTYSVTGGPGNVPIMAAIEQGGYGFFFDPSGVIYVLPSLSGSTTLSGTITAYAPAGSTFPNGQTQEQFALTGTASSSLLSGTFSGNGETGAFSLTPWVYPAPASVIFSPGPLPGFYGGPGAAAAVDLTMNANGTFSGSDAFGCTITGSIASSNIFNIFNVSLSSVGAGCAGNLSGLGFLSNTDVFSSFGVGSFTAFYMGVSNGTNGFIAEFDLP